MTNDEIDMTKCMAKECPNPPVHLVDFTSAGVPGVTWLPMCDTCKKLDDALTAYIKASPENMERVRVGVKNAEELERQ
jgi:hypothetical protein